ncbi:MAG TPA: DUF2239 family protein [Trueperaceae bacterium]|nr:DUF2239 family protein [Trueperaceae bacterium]
MPTQPTPTAVHMSATAFAGHRLLRSGPLSAVARAVKAVIDAGSRESVLVFDDATGRVIDLDLRGSQEDVVDRLSRTPSGGDASCAAVAGGSPSGSGAGVPERRGPGRPRLGVVAREVTLLPRHWAWLADQPGGASAALRRLVDEARRRDGAAGAHRTAKEAAYRFMTAIGGDLSGYEEALRALFSDDRARLEERLAEWPEDVRAHAVRLAFGAPGLQDGGRPPPGRSEPS